MKTVYDVKMALDYDTMIDIVNNYRKEQQRRTQKPRRKRNKWSDLFPSIKGIK